MKKSQISYQETEYVMQKALLSLLCSKSIEKIKVTELVRSAGICRATFYLYYSDIYELYENIIYETFDTIDHIIYNVQIRFFEDILTAIYAIYQVASHNRPVFDALLVKSQDAYFVKHIKSKLIFLIRQYTPEDDISANIVSLLSENIMSIMRICIEYSYDFSSYEMRSLTRQTLLPLQYCMKLVHRDKIS